MTGTSGARAVLVAADRIEAKIVEAEKLRTAIEEIRRLHAPVAVCSGCHLRECPGDCDWHKYDVDPTEIVCNVCCFDERDAARGAWCLEAHDHTADGPGCSTAEIVARAGL